MKKHRWIIISLALWGLVFLAAFGMRSLSMQTNKELAAIPLPQKPELENVEPKESGSKVELYRGEIQEKKKTPSILPSDERAERVQMAWGEVYKKESSKENDDQIPQSQNKAPTRYNEPIAFDKTDRAKENLDINDTITRKKEAPPQSGFHTQVINPAQNSSANTAIKASIWSEQEVSSGEAIKLKTAEEMIIEGQTLPAGAMLIGTCVLGKRLFIEISQISVGGKLRPVKLSCLDASDRQKGLIIQKPGMEEKLQEELASAALDEAISDLPVGGSLIRNGKNIIKQVISGRNKSKLILPHGYQLIITP